MAYMQLADSFLGRVVETICPAYLSYCVMEGDDSVMHAAKIENVDAILDPPCSSNSIGQVGLACFPND